MSHEQEYLVHRLTPRTRNTIVIATPVALAVGVAFVLLALVALNADSATAAAILFVLALFAGVAACSTRAVPWPWPPFPGGHKGWKVVTELIRLSPDAALRDYVFFGTLHDSNGSVPVLLHKQLIRHHMELVGATGRKKSAGIVTPVCSQLMASDNCSVVLIDLKGDNASYWNLRRAALKEGMTVRFFSLDQNEASCLLPILSDPAFQRLTLNEQAQQLVQAFGVSTSEAHGPGFFGGAIKSAFKRLLQLFQTNRRCPTFRDLYRLMLEKWAARALKMSHKDFEAASHAAFLLENLSDDPRLNIIGTEPIAQSLFDSAITADLPFRERCLIYLKLPALTELSLGRAIARLYVRLLTATATRWKGPRVEHVYCAYEEAQEVLQESLSTPLRQIRDYGMSFLFSHQCLSDLAKEEVNFLAPVVGNAGVKVFLSATDDDSVDYLQKHGGQRIRVLKSITNTTTDSPTGIIKSTGEQHSETLVPFIGPDEVSMLNARDDLALVIATPNKGLTKLATPTFIEILFSISERRHKAYKRLGWPAADGVTTVLAKDLPTNETSLDALAPPKKTTPQKGQAADGAATPSKRKRPPKPNDPEQQRQADEVAERLRRLGGK